jgi:acetolactate synthase-1/2/3 large subunit
MGDGATPARRTGGQVLADQLLLHGADLAFCVPGESYLPLLDALYEHRGVVRVVTCRHEAAAANAAEAYGKLTARPGVCMVTRGPGATHAATGVHTAMQDGSPMLLLVGQVARGVRGREAFQELDYEKVFGPMCKWAFEVDAPDRIPELVARAFATAASGRPGPVVLALPEDVLSARVAVEDAPRYRALEPSPDPGALAELRELLQRAERPLVLVGGGPWDAPSAEALTRWLLLSGLPAAASFRRQDVVDNGAACYAGHVGLGTDPRLLRRLEQADVLVALGTRLSEIETQGYTLPAPGRRSGRSLVHVHPDPRELGRVYQADLPVLSGVRPFAAALAELGPVDGAPWSAWARAARADYEDSLRPPPAPGTGVDLALVIAHLREALPVDAVIANGAGNYTVWIHRFHQHRRFGTQLAPQSGAMGYGLPAAMAAQLLHPDRVVVALAGDGDFQMSGQELATMVQEDLPVIVLVVNNGTLGTIRMHQERRFPRRVMATSLRNPDFVALARAYGAHASRVDNADDFPSALREARASGGTALIELRTDPEALTPRASLSEVREEGEARARVSARPGG